MNAEQNDDRVRLHLIVSGRVQGVFFRHSTMEEARQLGLGGWVRNLPSGEVEIVAEGPRKHLDILFAWAHDGPPSARVHDVRAEWSDYRGEFGSFRVR